MDSTTKFSDYIKLAVESGMTAIASTEHGKPLCWVSKKMACDAAGIKFIFGCEVYLTETLNQQVRDNYHTILLAKNDEGRKEILRAISKSCESDHVYYTNRMTFDEFLDLSENIISTSACLASPLNRLPDSHPRYMELARKYTFFEIQHHNHPDQVEYNKRLYELSKITGTPLIAGTDTHSANRYKAECRSVLMAAKGKSYGDEDSFDLSFKTATELADAYMKQNSLPEEVYMEAIQNTNLLATMCDDFELDRTNKYPISYGSPENDTAKLEEIVYEKFKQKCDDGVIPEHEIQSFEKDLREELDVFKKIGMSGFMLSMSEILSWCHDNGIPTGPARGSVSGSKVAFVADITDVDPVRWKTNFARFANVHRIELGDIDTDVKEEDRPKIFEHIIDVFGTEKTARVASFGTLQDKATIDEIFRALSYRYKLSKGYDAKEARKIKLPDDPYSIANADKVKKEYDVDPSEAREKYPDIFYYFDGIVGTKISQSVHPAGMIITCVNVPEEYGVFKKDDDYCVFLDMDEVHDVGVPKYDMLILKTVGVLDDTCKIIDSTYPKAHNVNWNDDAVWEDMRSIRGCIFQFEEQFAYECLKKFRTNSIEDMSLVTAAIRPSGASYRDDLFARKIHHNPSKEIDDLLSENLNRLVYQEDIIAFLSQICGLSGSDADSVRRMIAQKRHDELSKWIPIILEGYCNHSQSPREQAEEEAKEFLQVIEDASSYMFNKGHSISYCMIGYMCGYYRYYYPYEFLTAYLNNAANDKQIAIGTRVAKMKGIKVTLPKFGASGDEYGFNKEKKMIAKGVSSIKYMGSDTGSQLLELSNKKKYTKFVDIVCDIKHHTNIDSRQLESLIKIDFFSEFGNQKELLTIYDFCERFKFGDAKQMKKESVAQSAFSHIIEKYSNGKTKQGKDSKTWQLLDVGSILRECEDMILSIGLKDLSDVLKIQNFEDIMGYSGYSSGKEEDRKKLFVKDVYPLNRKSDGKQFGYSVITQSIGSGKETRFTVFNTVFNKNPINKGCVINCNGWKRDGQYFTLTDYSYNI